MPNWREFFGELGGRENGGNVRVLDVLENQPLPWTFVPEMVWHCPVSYGDLAGPAVIGQTLLFDFTTTANTAGVLRWTFTGGNLEAPVVVDVAVAEGDTAAVINASADAAISAEGDLAATAASVAATGATTLRIIFEASIGRVFVNIEWIPSWEQWLVEAAGDYTAGNYDVTFQHENLGEGALVLVRTPGNTNLATTVVDVEANIEARDALLGIVASADDDGAAAVTIITEDGITGLVVGATGPAEAQWEVFDDTGSVTVAQTDSVTLNLGALAPRGAFPEHCMRGDVAIDVTTTWSTFPVERTITIGDANAPDGVLGDTPHPLYVAGRTAGDQAAAEVLERYEAAWTPIAVINVQDPTTLVQGELMIEIVWSPSPGP